MRNESVAILCQSFLKEAIVSISGAGRFVHSLTLSIQHISSADHGVVHRPRCPEDDVEEAVNVTACYMPESRRFSSVDGSTRGS